MPSPSCIGSNLIDFIYDHAGVRKIKSAATPTIYPNQFYTDFGGGSGNQFKHIFIGSERILTKKSRIAPDREHWYYHGDHLHSTAMVTNEKSQLVDAVHYFPYGEVWLEERPSSLPADYFFTAKEFDPETGFYDFGARYLDPRFSKWMTADPALGSYLPGAGKAVAFQSPALANNWRGHPDLPGLGGTFTPSNLALYGYGHQNPATLADPNGKAATTAAGCMVGGGIGSLFGGVGALPGCGIGALISTAATVVGVIIVGGVLLSSDTPVTSQSNDGDKPAPLRAPPVTTTGDPSQLDPLDPNEFKSEKSATQTNPYLRGLNPQAGTRGTGVDRAIRLEVELVQKTGSGTVNWSAEEVAFIRQNGRLPDNIVGHHINNVGRFPEWQGDPRNIMFVRGRAGNFEAHGGSWRNPTMGSLIDRQALIDQAARGVPPR
jgi:RHS repeat-associated protein